MKPLGWCLMFLILVVAGLGTKQVYRMYHTDTLELVTPLPAARAARQIYPFSVIPGGVANSQELADSMAKDPVARDHYEGIEPSRLWTSALKQPLLAYVSYRKGDKVYWTDHKVKIAAGEQVLTDGDHMVRGRCGNRIAFNRPTPLPAIIAPPEGPPPDLVFESPLPALMPPTVSDPVPPPPALLAQSRTNPKAWEPPVWCCSARKVTPTHPVPEPGTLALIGAGLFAAAAYYRRTR